MTLRPISDPVPCRARVLFARACAACAAALALACGAAAGSDRMDIVLRGLVSDEKGRPLSGALITATGPQGLVTGTDLSGRFTLSLRPGTVAEIQQSRARYTIEARYRGHRVPLLGGRDRLELELRAAAAAGGEARLSVASSAPDLARMLENQFAVAGSVTAFGDVEFSRRPAPGAAGAAAPGHSSAKPPASPQAAAAPTSAPTSAAATPAAPKSVSRPPAAAAPAPAATSSAPAHPPASGAKPSSSGKAHTAPGAGTPGAAPAAARGGAPPTASLPAAQRPPEREPVTALELLEEVKIHGSLTAADRYADSVRVAERDRARHEAAVIHEAERTAEALRKEQERSRRYAEQRTRDSLEAIRSEGTASPAREPVSAEEAEHARRATASKERHAAEEREREARRAESRRRSDSLRVERAALDARRAEEALAEMARMAFRRDSVFGALRARDSLRRVAVIRDSLRAVARRDSARALRPQSPALHLAPVVGGREAGSGGDPRAGAGDSCTCRIRGTVEIDTDTRLDAAPRITIGVHGSPALSDVAQLFMGSPRAFEIPRVPCGPVTLDVSVLSRYRFVPRDPGTLSNLSCTSGGLIQPRIVLVPAPPR